MQYLFLMIFIMVIIVFNENLIACMHGLHQADVCEGCVTMRMSEREIVDVYFTTLHEQDQQSSSLNIFTILFSVFLLRSLFSSEGVTQTRKQNRKCPRNCCVA